MVAGDSKILLFEFTSWMSKNEIVKCTASSDVITSPPSCKPTVIVGAVELTTTTTGISPEKNKPEWGRWTSDRANRSEGMDMEDVSWRIWRWEGDEYGILEGWIWRGRIWKRERGKGMNMEERRGEYGRGEGEYGRGRGWIWKRRGDEYGRREGMNMQEGRWVPGKSQAEPAHPETHWHTPL
jgi:hypothetical protein